MTKYADLPDHLKQALQATQKSRLGAMLSNAFMGEDQPTDRPRFISSASVTSDGFIMWNFIDGKGEHHYGALAGDWQSFLDNIRGLVVHLGWAYQKDDKQIPVSEASHGYMLDLQDKLNAVLNYTYDHRINFNKELKGYLKVKREALHAAKEKPDHDI